MQRGEQKWKHLLAIVIIIAISGFQGCQKDDQPLLVIIQGYELCSQKYSLPLIPQDCDRLDDYLKKGGDIKKEPGSWAEYDQQFYHSLLETLSTGESIKLSLLFATQENGDRILSETGKKWFKGPLIYGIIDSRLPKPDTKSTRPISVNDGHLWWIFFRDTDNPRQVAFVMVAVPLEQHLKPEYYK